MKFLYLKLFVLLSILISFSNLDGKENYQRNFQGKAVYMSKSKMNLGKWGQRLSEMQKKQIQARLKNRLEKTYTLTFNREESFYKEDETLDAISGATDSWGKNFTPGEQYKNIKSNIQVQEQEFYGKQFLVKDSPQKIDWELGSETKKIGQYECYKATAMIPTNELTWYSFSWNKLRNQENKEVKEQDIGMTNIEAWYSPAIPVSFGPNEFWGLPGLILEVSFGNTTLLCSEVVINPKEKIEIEPPTKGEVVTKKEYKEIIFKKMKEFRDMRRGRRRRS